jgi:uncharacterized protein YggU (UPF0235/DUF167 family)
VIDVRERDGVVLVSVRVRPRSRPGLSADDGGLVISVAAPAEKGRATEEARRALADALGLPPSAVTLRTGATARRKVFAVTGIVVADARNRLFRVAGNDG